MDRMPVPVQHQHGRFVENVVHWKNNVESDAEAERFAFRLRGGQSSPRPPAGRIFTTFGSNWPRGTALELAEKLVIEVVAVGQHHPRRIPHRRMQHHTPGLKEHGEAFAAALGVPHHARAPVPQFAPVHHATPATAEAVFLDAGSANVAQPTSVPTYR